MPLLSVKDCTASPPTDEPQVTISEKCHGEVRINNVSVHSGSDSSDYADIVCKERNCRDAVFIENKPANEDAEVYHMNCEKYHDRLGKCSRYKGKSNKEVLSVYCVGEYAIPKNGKLVIKFS